MCRVAVVYYFRDDVPIIYVRVHHFDMDAIPAVEIMGFLSIEPSDRVQSLRFPGFQRLCDHRVSRQFMIIHRFLSIAVGKHNHRRSSFRVQCRHYHGLMQPPRGHDLRAILASDIQQGISGRGYPAATDSLLDKCL